VDNLVFQATDRNDTEVAKKKLIATLARKHRFDPDDEEAVVMWDTTEGFKFLNAFFLGFRIFLGVVGGVFLFGAPGLVVGPVGFVLALAMMQMARGPEDGPAPPPGADGSFLLEHPGDSADSTGSGQSSSRNVTFMWTRYPDTSPSFTRTSWS
jgi:hypothetical protein